MEIFQTIWTALTTENEFLISIVSIPLIFLEMFINMLLFLAILNIQASKKAKLTCLLLIPSLSIVIGLIVPNPYRSILNFIIMILLIHRIFKINILKSIFATIFPLIIVFILDSISAKICLSFFNLTIEEATSIPIVRFTINIVTYLSTFLLYLILRNYHIFINILDTENKKYKVVIFFDFLIGIIALFVQFYLVGFYINVLPSYIVALSIISFLSYFVISIFTLTRLTKLELTKQDLEQEKENNRILKEMQDELHGFRHDFSNIMCTIGGYIQLKDMDGLSKYYSQIQKDVAKLNNLGTLNSEVINNPAIFILISSKYSKALELGIDMNVNVFLDLNNLNMKIYEFTRILGILLDNAIEAAKECEEKIINIEIRKDSKRNRQLLIIENTYSNKDIDTEKIFEKKYSTKEGNSGLGLWEVRKILSKNTNLNLFTTKNDEFFKQQLEMYNI